MSEEQVRLGSIESIGVLDLGENEEIDNLDYGDGGVEMKDDLDIDHSI